MNMVCRTSRFRLLGLINQFHNAESLRCDIVIASNPGIVSLATRASMVVYPIKYKSKASYVSRDPNNPWPSEKKPLDTSGMIAVSIDDYKDEEGEWFTFTNTYGKRTALIHQQNYSTCAKAVQAHIEDADSGALKEKIRCKRITAKHGHGPRARSAGGQVRQ